MFFDIYIYSFILRLYLGCAIQAMCNNQTNYKGQGFIECQVYAKSWPWLSPCVSPVRLWEARIQHLSESQITYFRIRNIGGQST